jgi:hypothetical protein
VKEAKAPATSGPAARGPASFAMPAPTGAAGVRIGELKQDFDVNSSRPFLAVESCTTNGVELAFDWKCLEHEGFCASMPVRCVFTGEDNPRNLLSRPLSFVDRSGATVRSAQEVETRYQHKIVTGQTPRDLMRVMGLIDGIAKPFNHPVPYYVEQHHTGQSLRCWSVKRGESYTCHVQVPDGWYALEWVARVNGICGPEYDALAAEVAMLSSDAWSGMSEQCRGRIEVWCKFLPMEEFRLYLTDVDFGRHDEGLAGLVVTNRRLIYCKYHHRGEIELENGGSLMVKRNGVWSNLVYEYDGSRTRVVKIHTNRIGDLTEELSDTPLRVEQVEAAAEEQAQA